MAVLFLGCSSSSSQTEASARSQLVVTFTPPSGTFVDSQTVKLSTIADAEVHFTLDGSLPTADSPTYTEPLVLDASTRLRALAVKKNGDSAGGEGARSSSVGAGGATAAADSLGEVQSSSYLRLNADAAGFVSHLPLLIIHTFESGRIDSSSSEFVSARLQVHAASQGVSHTLGPAVVDTRIGIHVRGETSRAFPKKSYALEFRGETTDDDVDRPFLGMPAESDWAMADPISMDRSLIRNALAFELSNRIGRYAPRTRFAEAYLVDDGGEVRTKSFLGVYTVMEKIKRGSERVNVQKLLNEVSESALSGGYVLRDDKGDADLRAANSEWQFVYPDNTEMASPSRSAALAYLKGFLDGFGRSLEAKDFTDPTTHRHYSEYIDVNSFVDYNIINALLKNVDGMRYSIYYYKDRDGRLGAGPVWDFDRSSGTPYDDRATNPEEWKEAGSDGTDFLTQGFWGQLLRDPAFKARYIERFTQLLKNEFSPDNLDRVVDTLASTVGEAADRDFERWPAFPPQEGSHDAEIRVLKDFLRRRVAFLQAELAQGL